MHLPTPTTIFPLVLTLLVTLPLASAWGLILIRPDGVQLPTSGRARSDLCWNLPGDFDNAIVGYEWNPKGQGCGFKLYDEPFCPVDREILAEGEDDVVVTQMPEEKQNRTSSFSVNCLVAD